MTTRAAMAPIISVCTGYVIRPVSQRRRAILIPNVRPAARAKRADPPMQWHGLPAHVSLATFGGTPPNQQERSVLHREVGGRKSEGRRQRVDGIEAPVAERT